MTYGGQKRGATTPQTENGQAAAVDGATATDTSRLPDTSPATGHEEAEHAKHHKDKEYGNV